MVAPHTYRKGPTTMKNIIDHESAHPLEAVSDALRLIEQAAAGLASRDTSQLPNGGHQESAAAICEACKMTRELVDTMIPRTTPMAK
jgi:hypothetical protein